MTHKVAVVHLCPVVGVAHEKCWLWDGGGGATAPTRVCCYYLSRFEMSDNVPERDDASAAAAAAAEKVLESDDSVRAAAVAAPGLGLETKLRVRPRKTLTNA